MRKTVAWGAALATIACGGARADGGITVDGVRGVEPALLPRYPSPQSGASSFTCLDDSRTIPVAQLNDDYCDCADGSDEPGACGAPTSIPQRGPVELCLMAGTLRSAAALCSSLRLPTDRAYGLSGASTPHTGPNPR